MATKDFKAANSSPSPLSNLSFPPPVLLKILSSCPIAVKRQIIARICWRLLFAALDAFWGHFVNSIRHRLLTFSSPVSLFPSYSFSLSLCSPGSFLASLLTYSVPVGIKRNNKQSLRTNLARKSAVQTDKQRYINIHTYIHI